MKKDIIFYSLLISLLFVCALLSGCRNTELSSDWRDYAIIIDGKYTDWKGTESYSDDKAKVVINLLNDEDYLYICLITRNRQVETKIMDTGLLIWFNPDGVTKKIFGIHFPTGLRNMGMSLEEDRRAIDRDWQDQEDKSDLIDREKERWRDRNFNKQLETLEGLQDKLRIMSGPFDAKNQEKLLKPPAGRDKRGPPDKDFLKNREGPGKVLSLEEAAKFGIEARVGRENDYFVYELKVPLLKSVEHPYAIEAKVDQPIGLELEIAKPGMGRGKGPGDRGGGRMPPERGPGMYSRDCFRLQATVVLSTK